MARVKKSSVEPFTMVPNRLIRSKVLNVYEKLILCGIISCGDESFPSYTALAEWAGCSRDRAWKALRKLESNGLICRFKKEEKIYYTTPWSGASIINDADAELVRYADLPVRQEDYPVRMADSTSPYSGLPPVRLADSIKNSLKRTIKNSSAESFSAEEIGKVIDLELAIQAVEVSDVG